MAMATRAIITSQPDVACEICLRRLLRGEQPEVFLAGGQRRTVCELCVPRASDEGWLRESDDHPVSRRALRGGRGRTLLDRLRQLRDPASGPLTAQHRQSRPSAADGELYEFLPGPSLSSASKPAAFFEESFEDQPGQMATEPPSPPAEAHVEPSNTDLKTARAIEVFTSSDVPRRIAGIARSLGSASVTARQADESSSRVEITVAWELCWYRYEVDLADELTGAVLTGDGMELDELPDADRAPNAAADERGVLHLL
jgi:hypothetical protein